MALFTRSTNPFGKEVNYTLYGDVVRKDFQHCCGYCLITELLAGGMENFELDHFKPKAKFPLLKNDFLNIFYACHVCNKNKWSHWPTDESIAQGYRYVDFCSDTFEAHFEAEENGNWKPLTKAAEYTTEKIRLNRGHLLELRKLLNDISREKGLGNVEWTTIPNGINDLLETDKSS